MLTRADVKLHNEYDYIRAVAPTTDENSEAGFYGGQTWLDTATGASYKLTDPDAGTWTAIEEGYDAKIDARLGSREYALFRLTGSYFYRYRQESLNFNTEVGPDSLDRDDFDTLGRFVSVFAEWAVTNAGGDPVTSKFTSSAIFGDPTDVIVGDWIEIVGSKRLDGLYEVTAVDSESITVEADLSAQTDRFLIVLVSVTDDFRDVVGRMIWFDVFHRNQRGGLRGERIGSYSWTAGPEVGGVGYPEEIAGEFMQYLNLTPMGTADYVP